jgi:hypothetical protein
MEDLVEREFSGFLGKVRIRTIEYGKKAKAMKTNDVMQQVRGQVYV